MSGYHLLEEAATVLLSVLDEHDVTDECRRNAARWLDDYRKWHETIQAQLPACDETTEMVTKTGRIITDMDIEAWVNEAEAHG